METKDAEIAFLKAQLKKSEDENRAVKEDKARILKEQMATLNRIAAQPAGDRQDASTFRLEDLDKVIFESFNNDLKKRLDFVSKVLDW